MKSHRVLATCAALGVVVVVASAVTSTVRFTGPRWVPHWNPDLAVKPRQPPPSPPGQGTPPLLPRGSSHLLGTILFWVLIVVAAIVVVLLLRWLLRLPLRSRRRTRSADVLVAASANAVAEPEPEPEPPVLRRGIDQALVLLEENREPADAVIRAWLGLEESAADAGVVRRSSETPTEFTSRVMSRAFADDHAVTTLLELYLRARFGARPVTAQDVAAVRAALADLSRTWEVAAAGTNRAGRADAGERDGGRDGGRDG